MGEKELQTVEEGQTALVSGEVVHEEPKRLLRSRKDRVLFGVCGGIGQYFGVDPVLIRALWVLFTLVTAGFPGVILYLVAAVVVPENKGEEAAPRWRLPVERHVLWGGLLILVGLFFLFRSFQGSILPSLPGPIQDVWGFGWNVLRSLALPIVLVGLGLILIFGIARKGEGKRRRLTRSREDRMLTGVCGGLGRYFKVDSTWIRLGWAVLTIVSLGVGAVVYLVAMLAMPEEATEA